MTPKRFAMVTIGQTPRVDMVPDIREALGGAAALVEFGALDGLSDEAIRALAPSAGEQRLVTRLADGREVTVAKHRMHELMGRLLRQLDDEGFDAIVLLCTGAFERLDLRTPLIESQLVVDETVMTLADTIKRLGVLVPHQEQIGAVGVLDRSGSDVKYSFASPYSDLRFVAAGQELADTDLIIMHCMGYSEAMRQEVAAGSGRPVLLARQIVGSAVREFSQTLA